MDSKANASPLISTTTIPRVPPELCDKIIDCLAPPPPSPPRRPGRAYYTPDDNESQRMDALLCCTTVCRDWLPRSRIHLYSIAWVSSAKALHHLNRTLLSTSGEDLRPLVTQFVVAPRVWESLDLPLHGYLPLRTFLDIKCPIRQFVLSNFFWQDTEYPPFEHVKMVRPAKRIEHCQLTSVVFPSLLMSFQFIYTFRYLSQLSLIGVLFSKPPKDTDITAMIARYPTREYWAAPSLRILEVGGPGDGIIPARAVRLFGSLIEHFRLTLYIGDPIEPTLRHFHDRISDYQNLKSLRLTLQPCMSFKPPLAGSIDEGVRVWNHIHDYLLGAIYAVESPTLHTFSVLLLSQQVDPDTTQDQKDATGVDSPWKLPCHYYHTRSGVLDTVFARDVRDALTSHTFGRLTTLELIVYDNPRVHGEKWWKKNLQNRMQGLRPGVIEVEVRDATGHDKLWVSE